MVFELIKNLNELHDKLDLAAHLQFIIYIYMTPIRLRVNTLVKDQTTISKSLRLLFVCQS